MDRIADTPTAERSVAASVMPATERRDGRSGVRGVAADVERHNGADALVSQLDLFAGASAKTCVPPRAATNPKIGAPSPSAAQEPRKVEVGDRRPGASVVPPTRKAPPKQPAPAAGHGTVPRGRREVPDQMTSRRDSSDRGLDRSWPPAKTASRGATMTQSRRIPRLLTVAEAAEFLRVCAKTVRRAIARGDLRSHDVGRQVRVSEEDLMAFLNRGRR